MSDLGSGGQTGCLRLHLTATKVAGRSWLCAASGRSEELFAYLQPPPQSHTLRCRQAILPIRALLKRKRAEFSFGSTGSPVPSAGSKLSLVRGVSVTVVDGF